MLEAFYPILLHGLAVGLVVETSALFHIPLADVIAHQRLAVGSTDHDTTRIGNGLGSLHLEESHRSLVHGRPDGIGSQTKQ